jgi:hypothetical protein
MANEGSATIVFPEVISNVTRLVKKHTAIVMHTFEVELILLGFGVEVLVNLVPFRGDAFEFLVWSF